GALPRYRYDCDQGRLVRPGGEHHPRTAVRAHFARPRHRAGHCWHGTCRSVQHAGRDCPGPQPRQAESTPMSLRVSVLVPVYNEAATIESLVGMVRAVPMEHEIICVNDGSTDGSAAILDRLLSE